MRFLQLQAKLSNSPSSPFSATRPRGRLPQSEDSRRIARQILDLVKIGVPVSVQQIDGQVEVLEEVPHYRGSFCEVYLGEWMGEEKVCLRNRD